MFIMRIMPDMEGPTRRPAGPRRPPAPDRAAEVAAGLQVRGACPRCGKRCYGTRRSAKRAARLLYPGSHMGRYRCGQWWHVTSRPERAKKSSRGPGRPA